MGSSLKLVLILCACLCARAHAQTVRVEIPFEIVHATEPGESVFVVGSLPELGSWDPRYAVKLQRRDFPTWRVRIALPADREFSYAFVVRQHGAGELGDPANATYISGLFSANTSSPSVSARQNFSFHNAIVVESTLNNPTLYVRNRGSFETYTALQMEDIGNGLEPGSVKWAAFDHPVTSGGVEFYLRDDAGNSVPESGRFSTALNSVYIRDSQLFGEVPPNTASDPVLLPSTSVTSTILGEDRTIRVLLPRNYGLTPGKRYPVLYMHDGQGLYGSGRKWLVDTTVPDLINKGVIREIIVVGIYNAGTESRFRDYVPDGDASANGPGAASQYTAFIRDELMPMINAQYMTLTGPKTTGTAGSSLGAIASIYQGWEYPELFGRVGAFSGAWPFSPNFNQRLNEAATGLEDLRLYIDSGDAGVGSDYFSLTASVRDTLLARDEELPGFAIEGNLQYRVGFGDEHDEYAWARRLPGALAYLYPADEAGDNLKQLVVQRRGDADGDGAVLVEDLYEYSRLPAHDFDNDGLKGEEGDLMFLTDLLRAGELADLKDIR